MTTKAANTKTKINTALIKKIITGCKNNNTGNVNVSIKAIAKIAKVQTNAFI